MKKWFIGILVIVFILLSQIGIKENTDVEDRECRKKLMVLPKRIFSCFC